VTGYITKRTKASTPEHEDVDKRKCRMCIGGHREIGNENAEFVLAGRGKLEGVHYN